MSVRANSRQRKMEKKRLFLEWLERREVMAGLIVDVPQYDGMAIARGNGSYDLQPSILYDATDNHDANRNGKPDRLYTMAWLGRYATGDIDKAPAKLQAGDRIYMAFSEDGKTWGNIQVVLKGSGGINGPITADDHLLGSPSLLKVNNKYYMFYEAYSTWATPINRFYSFQRGDNWITNGVDLPAANNQEGYRIERNIGFAPLLVKSGTHPVYSGEVIYNFPTGPKNNHYLTKSQPFVGRRDGATWSVRNQGEPLFWLYDEMGPGRKPLYSYWDAAHANTFATEDPNGDGVRGAIRVELLGYVADKLDGPDMVGAMENRIMMATSTDGVNFTRFLGPGRGGAVITPQNESVATYNPITWKLDLTFGAGKPSYGAGYPSALVRDGQLELYFTDEDSVPGTDQRRIRMPLNKIEDSTAWRDVRAAGKPALTQDAPYGSDIKWSPLHQRYFASYIESQTPGIMNFGDPNFRQAAAIVWSDASPDPTLPPTFPAGNKVVLPDGGRVAIWGGLLADGLGNTLDRGGVDPLTKIDAFFESYPRGGNFIFDTDIAHASVVVRSAAAQPNTPKIASQSLVAVQATATDLVAREALGSLNEVSSYVELPRRSDDARKFKLSTYAIGVRSMDVERRTTRIIPQDRREPRILDEFDALVSSLLERTTAKPT